MYINSPPPPVMDENRVGSLLYRDYDAHMITQNGGKLVQNTDVNATDFYTDILHLIKKLKLGNIDGFLLDQYTLAYTYSTLEHIATEIKHELLSNSMFRMNDIPDALSLIEFFLNRTLTTRVPYEGVQQLTYGVLVREHRDYEYFKDAAKDKRFRDNVVLSNRWSTSVRRKEHKDPLFAHDGQMFHSFLIAIAVLVGVVFVLGMAFDLKRTKFSLKKMFPRSAIVENGSHGNQSVTATGGPIVVAPRINSANSIPNDLGVENGGMLS